MSCASGRLYLALGGLNQGFCSNGTTNLLLHPVHLLHVVNEHGFKKSGHTPTCKHAQYGCGFDGENWALGCHCLFWRNRPVFCGSKTRWNCGWLVRKNGRQRKEKERRTADYRKPVDHHNQYNNVPTCIPPVFHIPLYMYYYFK